MRACALLVAFALFAAACASDADTGQGSITELTPTETLAAETVSEERLVAGVNLAIADVPLGDVVFDTFDGGSIALAEASEEQILGLLNAIPPLNDPNYVPASDATWADDDLVLGYVDDDGNAWAYPHRVLNFHEIVNATFAERPVAITYCPLCGSGLVFDRRSPDERHDGVLTFDNTSALYENDMVMVDRETNTYWWQVGGRGIVGHLTGASLTVLASMTTTWGSWRDLHPDTMVLSAEQGFGRRYDVDPFTSYGVRLDTTRDTPFPISPEAFADDRLAPSTRVVGFWIDGAPTAVPVLVNEPTVVAVDDGHVVFLDGRGGGALHSPILDGETLSFEATEDGFVDSATGSTWNAAGRAIGGPAVDRQLTSLPSSSSFWFAWVSTLDGRPTDLIVEERP